LVLRDLGRLDEALAAAERSLEIRERHLPADHTSVGWALWLTGGLLRARGDLAPARASLERSLAIQETALGRDSYAAALGHQQLGALCAAEGDLEAAVGAFAWSIEILQGLGQSRQPDLSWTLRQSAYVQGRLGNRNAAEHGIRRSLDVALEAFGPDHPEVAWSLAALARLEVDDEHLQEARSLFLRAERILVSALGPSARAVGSMRYNLACVDALAGRREDALAHLRGALETTWAWAGAADDADLASLRGDAEYRSFVDEVRRRLEQTG
jgi:tetratricopeptide (TPR) repeat protein